MQAYIRYDDRWSEVLVHTRNSISEIPQVNPKLVEFYTKENEGKVIRRIKRIVREETKVQAMLYQRTRQPQFTQSTCTSGQYTESKEMQGTTEKSSTKLQHVVEKKMRRDSSINSIVSWNLMRVSIVMMNPLSHQRKRKNPKRSVV